MGQDIIVGLIVAVCAGIVVWRLVRRLRGGGGCGCSGGSHAAGECSGCEGCALVEQCKAKSKRK
ncbi:MAG TPA: hypothetical protein H9888_06845 [Candidatus Rikenella faecigallinarum]|uniref:FeoB-associated Cys-rich membrane protein n=1 Tax=Candidatus Rikenella faecigallinarum TaxID=2838745 RepID=A0A9D1QDI3_9BACT|nr:hypothetical protein [Candidatus Rikenella faecigallinarum]